MYSVLRYPALVLPTTFPGHGPSAESAGSTPLKPKPTNGYLSPLYSLLRNPGATLERLVEGAPTFPPQDGSEDDALADRQKLLYLRLQNASNFEEWRATAIELDAIEGHNVWKNEIASPDYDFALVEARLKQLDDARVARDSKRMLFLIRTALTRHLGGMGNFHLYRHSHIGTKNLIERYILSALETLSTLVNDSHRAQDAGISSRILLDQVLAARQSFGRSALLLSGGGTFGMNHIGVVKSLWENKVLPRIISGASAGSIVCAVLCTKIDEEVPAVLDDFCSGDLGVFHKEGEDEGLMKKMARFLKFGALFDVSNLIRVMRKILGDMTFQEAYNRTRRILNICVSSAGLYELPRLLNYVTAPNVVIWSAVAASCSVPFIFSPASLSAKDPRTGQIVPWNPSPQRWIDGSVDNDLPMTRLAEMFNVNHFIVSQVNPHVVPFLDKEHVGAFVQADSRAYSLRYASDWMGKLASLAKGEALHRMELLSECGVFPNTLTKAKSVLSQRYSGDITVLPEIPYTQFPHVLTNPTSEFMLQAQLCGERATWPKLSRIQNHCAIELALDDAVQQLRARVAFSPSQVDLRLNVIAQPMVRIKPEEETPKRNRRKTRRGTKNVERRHQQIKDDSSTSSTWIPPNIAANSARMLKRDGSLQKPGQTDAILNHSVDFVGSGHHSSDLDENILSSSVTQSASEQFDSGDSIDDYNSSSADEDIDSSIAHHRRTSRQLFPHGSQPATPSSSTPQHTSYFSTPTNARPLATQSTAALSKRPLSMTMTSSTQQDLPSATTVPNTETQYKEAFHRPRSWTSLDQQEDIADIPTSTANWRRSISRTSTQRSGSATPQTLSTLLSPTSPLEPDISGTRGMLLRKKRSMSTGIQSSIAFDGNV